MNCKRHPTVETRVTCSDCGDPICPDCMVFTPVGAKCPTCARLPKTALVRVRPERMVLTVVLGLGAAAAAGLLFGILLRVASFFTFIVAFGIGMAVGETVSWASGRYHGTRLAAWAAGCAAFAVMLPFMLTGVADYGAGIDAIRYALTVGGIFKLLWVAIAAYGAWQRNA
ncbi:MAG: B-box zinc finger protein [Thermoleophilia bacterium]